MGIAKMVDRKDHFLHIVAVGSNLKLTNLWGKWGLRLKTIVDGKFFFSNVKFYFS